MTSSEAFETIDRIVGTLEMAKAEIVARDLKESTHVIRERLKSVAKDRLLSLMEFVSEDTYCSGWMMGLESDLWEAVSAGTGCYRHRPELDELRQLAHDAGGWWRWNEDAGECQFVPMSDWLKMYKGASK